jgi:ubiquinone/menaquinone biosynthesis C-methylase UbiE
MVSPRREWSLNLAKSERRRYAANHDSSSRYNALSYDDIAEEYYNASLHPTCSNFRDASVKAIKKFSLPDNYGQIVLDLGSGKSILPDVQIKYGELVLADSSAKMISHSNTLFTLRKPHMIVSDARHLALKDNCFDLIIMSLGDPFNLDIVWKEVARVMKIEGVCVFTTPTHHWADQFRRVEANEKIDHALFVLSDKSRRYAPSFVPDDDSQKTMFERAGLVVCGIVDVPVSELDQPVSWKLLVDGRGLSVVRGYLLQRRMAREGPSAS